MSDSERESEQRREAARAYSQRLWRLASLGGTMASEILAGALLGWGLDYLLGTRPWFLVILTIGGLVIGMIGFIRSALREQRTEQSRRYPFSGGRQRVDDLADTDQQEHDDDPRNGNA